MEADQREALLTLLLARGLGQTLIGRCIETFGCAAATLEAKSSQLATIKGISPRAGADIRRSIDQHRADRSAQRELELAQQRGVRLIGRDDPTYPQLLKHIPDPPWLLWVKGHLNEQDALSLAMVGARRCTHYGREQAQRFAHQATQAGLTVVSGGAYGVDAAAHRGALSAAAGRTIAVLGSGLADTYPREHSDLFEQISKRGAVISEFPMQTAPIAENFPRRNRVISGLSLGTLVIEAAQRSGALITARLCVEEHGRELMALPGRVDSQASAGCHKMIREGWANLVTSISDVLDVLGETGQLLKAQPSATPASAKPNLFEQNLSGTQQKIVAALAEARSLDQITAWTALPIAQVQADLTILEIRGTVRRDNGLFVCRHASR